MILPCTCAIFEFLFSSITKSAQESKLGVLIQLVKYDLVLFFGSIYFLFDSFFFSSVVHKHRNKLATDKEVQAYAKKY